MCHWFLFKDILHTFSNRKEIITQFRVSVLLKMSTSQWLSNVIMKSYRAILSLKFFIIHLWTEKKSFKFKNLPLLYNPICFHKWKIRAQKLNSVQTRLMSMYYAPTLCWIFSKDMSIYYFARYFYYDGSFISIMFKRRCFMSEEKSPFSMTMMLIKGKDPQRWARHNVYQPDGLCNSLRHEEFKCYPRAAHNMGRHGVYQHVIELEIIFIHT